MDVSAVASSTQSTTGQTSQSALGKDQFMKLLVAQLANQDPLNPLDDKEFIAQLAQFSSLEQMVEMNDHLGVLQDSQVAAANAQNTQLIGQEVVVDCASVDVTTGAAPPSIQFRLTGAATATTVKIVDAQGTTVRSIDAGALTAGQHTLVWDGKNDAGTSLASGTYTVQIDATDAAGAAVAATSETRGVVTAVAFDQGYAELVIGNRRVKPADVVQVLGNAANLNTLTSKAALSLAERINARMSTYTR
jgi:flagellar basal-body rod modification protein FlgD